MSGIDFCCKCNKWIAADTGTMRTGKDGEVEIVCNECRALEKHDACSIGDSNRSGTLND